jgi:hypothetical protein
MLPYHVCINYRTARGLRQWSTTVDAENTSAAFTAAKAAFRKRHHKARIDHAILSAGCSATSVPGDMI